MGKDNTEYFWIQDLNTCSNSIMITLRLEVFKYLCDTIKYLHTIFSSLYRYINFSLSDFPSARPVFGPSCFCKRFNLVPGFYTNTKYYVHEKSWFSNSLENIVYNLIVVFKIKFSILYQYMVYMSYMKWTKHLSVHSTAYYCTVYNWIVTYFCRMFNLVTIVING